MVAPIVIATGAAALGIASSIEYGNWGGWKWSGGEYILDGKEPDWNVRGIDELDRAFREHDRGWWNAEDAHRRGLIDEAEFARRIKEADRGLVEKMNGIDPATLSRAGQAMRFRALVWFSEPSKSTWNDLNDPNFRPKLGGVDPGTIARPFGDAKKFVPPRDPILLDLNGNGLDTVGLSANIHFDFDSDGVLTRTGWVGPNDALLVWDRNSNGSIDTGAELFGDFTVLPNGTLAPQRLCRPGRARLERRRPRQCAGRQLDQPTRLAGCQQ